MLKYKIIFLFILLSSCGARKVAVDKVDITTKIDSSSVVEKQEVVVTQNNINITTDTDEVEICPLSDTIPMIVNGITYKGARIKYKKTKTILVDTTKKSEAKKEVQKVKVVKDKKEKVFVKKIDKKESYSIYLWWLLIIFLVGLFFYVKNKLPKILP